MASYLLDNQRDDATRDHHQALSAVLNPWTFWRLSDLCDLAGSRCLEVGAGGGSVAWWLAEQAGDDGVVVATDLAGLLAPGGVLVEQAWVPPREPNIIGAPSLEGVDLYRRYRRTVADVFTAGGTDPTWGRRVHATMLRLGLAEVTTEIHQAYWTGGEAGCRLVLWLRRRRS